MENDKLRLEIYQDAFQPSIRELGKALLGVTKTARFVFAGFDYLSAKQDKWQRFLEKAASKVPEENLTEAHPQIVGPIIEGMKYTDVDSLIGEMFTDLLAGAIDKEKQDKSHPAFPQIIQQLSYDEAVILFFLKRKKYKVHQSWDLLGNSIVNMRTSLEEFPTDKLIYPKNIWMYMNHLNSLTVAGTWQYTQDEFVVKDGVQTGGITKSERKLSEFGTLFVEACVPDKFGDLDLE